MIHNSESLRDAFKYFFPRELPLLKTIPYLVSNSPCVVINIGAGAGTSGLAFIETRQDLILHTVDVTNVDSPLGSLYSERVVFEQAGYAPLMGDRWFQHHNDSKRLAQHWQGPVDIVFIDGDHSYEGCKGDILGWLPHISNNKGGGFMVIHDYLKEGVPFDPNGPHPKPWPGVTQAVNEFLVPKYEEFARQDSLIVFKIK